MKKDSEPNQSLYATNKMCFAKSNDSLQTGAPTMYQFGGNPSINQSVRQYTLCLTCTHIFTALPNLTCLWSWTSLAAGDEAKEAAHKLLVSFQGIFKDVFEVLCCCFFIPHIILSHPFLSTITFLAPLAHDISPFLSCVFSEACLGSFAWIPALSHLLLTFQPPPHICLSRFFQLAWLSFSWTNGPNQSKLAKCKHCTAGVKRGLQSGTLSVETNTV